MSELGRHSCKSEASAAEASEQGVDIRREQRLILRNALLAGLLCMAMVVGAWFWLPHYFQPPVAMSERIAFALQCDVFVLLWLLISVRMVSSGRYQSAEDNRGSAFAPPSPRIAIKVAFLQNTLGQCVVAIGVHVTLATLVTGDALFCIPAAVMLFAIGRGAFLHGYPKGAGARSFGMVTTVLPSLAGLGLAIVLVIRRVLH